MDASTFTVNDAERTLFADWVEGRTKPCPQCGDPNAPVLQAITAPAAYVPAGEPQTPTPQFKMHFGLATTVPIALAGCSSCYHVTSYFWTPIAKGRPKPAATEPTQPPAIVA